MNHYILKLSTVVEVTLKRFVQNKYLKEKLYVKRKIKPYETLLYKKRKTLYIFI